MRSVLIGAALLGALVLAGCGREGSSGPSRVVRLSVTDPDDTTVVRDDKVEVRGRVTPSTSVVMVRGRQVAISGDMFSATVPLDGGTNLIDVMASAEDAVPAMTAIRVTRVTTIPVPDVIGLSPGDATTELEARGLRADIHNEGIVFERLIPADAVVCDTDPGPGEQVDSGTTVKVGTAKLC